MSCGTIYRLVVLSVVLLSTLVVLGLSASVTATSVNDYSVTFTYADLGIATGGLTLLTVPTMIGIEATRKGAWTSMIVFEMCWLSALWVLWLVTAVLAAQAKSSLILSDVTTSLTTPA